MAMPEQLAEPSVIADEPQIVAAGVSLEDYLEYYAELGCEFVEGTVYKMTPVGLLHEIIRDYLRLVLQVYFDLRPVGRVLGEPFVMRLAEFPNRRREPDLIIVLKTNPHTLRETYMDGPADICIEIVSPGSVATDHGEKFEEYEKGGVPEYWIFDPIRNEARFYRLNEKGIYIRQSEDADGNYRTPRLPELVLHVPTLWQENLPGPIVIIEAVRTMLKDEA